MDQQQQPPPGDHAAKPLGWERFVHKKTIRVLLVETDEATRTAITAMLRRCKYQVIAAENGRHAWTFLQGMHGNIDLVLTEVDLFGIELLDRIMGHRVCRDIPVIMMSPYCSTATVFDCLCKGAVDFLHKPIRKHEMKNLWLHVWRRCQNVSSGGGSGSGSPVQTHECTKPKSGQGSNTYTGGNNDRNDDAGKGLNPRDFSDDGGGTQYGGGSGSGSGSHVQALSYTKPKSGPESNNKNGSNDRSDDASMGLNAKDGNDNGSGTQGQNSWTKRAVEIDSSQTMSPYQSTETPYSTCALAIHPNSEICSTRWLPDGKGLEIGDSTYAKTNDESCPNRPTNRQCEYPAHNNSNASTMENMEQPSVQAADLIGSMANTNDEFKGKGLKIDGPIHVKTDDESCPNGSSVKPADGWSVYPRENNLNASTMENLEEPIVRAADLIGSMAKKMDAEQAARAKAAPTFSSKVLSLELSLKRPRSTGYYANAIQKAIVNRPDLSALTRIFSRYSNACVVSNEGGPGYLRSSSPRNSSEAVKTDCPYNMKPSSDASLLKQGKDTSRDDIMASLELSLKRTRSNGDGANAIQEEKTNALRPSDLWAFTSRSNQGGVGRLVRSCSCHGNSSEAVKTGYPYNMKPSSDASLMQQGKDRNGDENMASLELSFKRPRSTGDGGSGVVAQSNVTDPWAPVEGNNSGSYNGTNNGSTVAAPVNTRAAGLNRYREKKKKRNFANMWQVRYEARKISAEKRPRVRGKFARLPPPADATAGAFER